TVRALKRLANVQAVLGAGVLLCAALMFFFAPPIVFPNITYSNPPAAVPTNNAVNVQTKQIGDLSVTLQVLPGRVGYANTVVVTMTDSNGMPVTDAQVRLITNMQIMDMGTQVATVKGGNPTYVATFEKGQAFSMAGVWVINVRIQRPGHAPVQGSFQVSLSL
ncbi:MAG: FixH family protein, partial [Chloroflexi bacterium]|nr:FixH family protein [Chloroflexota bacterium]